MQWVTNTIVVPVSFQTLQQLLVQPVARDLVERAERLVHQQQPRPPTSARAIATRWRMPPDSSCG